ncbi:hypothetical protein Tco_0412047 [Tanacetum coccineum]
MDALSLPKNHSYSTHMSIYLYGESPRAGLPIPSILLGKLVMEVVSTTTTFQGSRPHKIIKFPGIGDERRAVVVTRVDTEDVVPKGDSNIFGGGDIPIDGVRAQYNWCCGHRNIRILDMMLAGQETKTVIRDREQVRNGVLSKKKGSRLDQFNPLNQHGFYHASYVENRDTGNGLGGSMSLHNIEKLAAGQDLSNVKLRVRVCLFMRREKPSDTVDRQDMSTKETVGIALVLRHVASIGRGLHVLSSGLVSRVGVYSARTKRDVVDHDLDSFNYWYDGHRLWSEPGAEDWRKRAFQEDVVQQLMCSEGQRPGHGAC